MVTANKAGRGCTGCQPVLPHQLQLLPVRSQWRRESGWRLAVQGALANVAWLNDSAELPLLQTIHALITHADNTSTGLVTLHKQIRP